MDENRAIGMVAILAALGSTGPVGAETSAATQGMPQLLAGRLDAGSSHTCIVDDGHGSAAGERVVRPARLRKHERHR